MRRYGEEGARLWRLARGIDARSVDPEQDTKSISAETTFDKDIAEFRPLEQHLWALTERVSARLKASRLAGSTVTLKLKSADFKIRTRAESLGAPTQLAARIFAVGQELLRREVGATRFRLIGIGVSNLEDADGGDFADLLDRARRHCRARRRQIAREIRPRRGGEGPRARRRLVTARSSESLLCAGKITASRRLQKTYPRPSGRTYHARIPFRYRGVSVQHLQTRNGERWPGNEVAAEMR